MIHVILIPANMEVHVRKENAYAAMNALENTVKYVLPQQTRIVVEKKAFLMNVLDIVRLNIDEAKMHKAWVADR